MSTYIRKCLDIAPTAVITPGPNVANDYRNLRQQLWWPALRATTSHLRLWADWPTLQPSGDAAPGGCVAGGTRRPGRRRARRRHEARDAAVPLSAVGDGTAHIPAGSVADFEFFTWDRSRACRSTWNPGRVRTQLG